MAARTLWWFTGALLLNVVAAPLAMAQAIYEYTGNPYSLLVDNTPPAGSTFDTSMRVSGDFTLAVPLTPNMALTDISSSILFYSFDNGANTLTEADSSIFGAFNVATDSLGNISEWQFTLESRVKLGAADGPGDQRALISAAAITGYALDRGILQECTGGTGGVGGTCGPVYSDLGQITDAPGSWALIPEPSTALLVGVGLLQIAYRRRRAL